MNTEAITHRLREFANARDWEQFHSPKNLAMALAAESGELLEVFQWLTEEQSRELATDAEKLALVREEVADIFIYLIRLCDRLDIDLEQAAWDKIESNDKKYPVSKSKGSARKYTEL